jgi:hypothetical protein
MVAPAMDLDMWKHPSVMENVKKVNVGVQVLYSLSCDWPAGVSGEGRWKNLKTFF